MNWLEAVGTVVGILGGFVGLWSGYVNYFVPARLKLYLGDSLDIVHTEPSQPVKLHLECNFTNLGNKTAVLHKLSLQVQHVATGEVVPFRWKIFYDLKDGVARNRSKPTSLSIRPKDSLLQGIEFESKSSDFLWLAGEYEISIQGWYNKKSIEVKPNIAELITIDLPKNEANKIHTEVILNNIVLMSIVQINAWGA